MARKRGKLANTRLFTKKRIILAILAIVMIPMLYLFSLLIKDSVNSHVEDRMLAKASDEYFVDANDGWRSKTVSFGGENACFKGVCRYVEHKYRRLHTINQDEKKDTLKQYGYLKETFEIIEENNDCNDGASSPSCYILLANNEYEIRVSVYNTETDAFLRLELKESTK
jgi:hypothetical protein